MSFFAANKNFITQRLIVDMKSLSNEEKRIQYETIKEETRKRLKKYYDICSKPEKFYEEAFEQLAFYEQEYLLINLFFEKDVSKLFKNLSQSCLSDLQYLKEGSFSFIFYNFMKSNFLENRVNEFLKLEFTKLLSLYSDDWRSEGPVRNNITKRYGSWLMESNKTNTQIDLNIFSYIFFCKIWNNYDKYEENFTTKAIILYNTLNNDFYNLLKEGYYVNLNKIITNLFTIKEDLFVKDLAYYPLLDDSEHASEGYINQRNKFNKNMKLSENLCRSYVNESYVIIFDVLRGRDSIMSEKIQNELNDKLNKFQIPNSKELFIIKKIEGSECVNIVRKDFFRRLYIF